MLVYIERQLYLPFFLERALAPQRIFFPIEIVVSVRVSKKN